MNRKDKIFKWAVSLASITEIIVLFYSVVFVAIEEYDPVHIETIGITAIILSATVACGTFATIIYYTIKWKGTNSTQPSEG